MTIKAEDKRHWVKWLRKYGIGKFFDAFVRTAQYAEGLCINCGHPIYLDIVEGGGVPDWRTKDGDYGCDRSPYATDGGTGPHVPRKLSTDFRSETWRYRCDT